MQTELRQIVQVGDLTISGANLLAGDCQMAAELTAPAGKAGTWKGVGEFLLLPAGGVTVFDLVAVFWANGSRSNCVVSEVSGNNIKIAAAPNDGYGDAWPAADTAVVVAIQAAYSILGTVPLPSYRPLWQLVHSTRRAAIAVFDSAGTFIYRLDLAAGSLGVMAENDIEPPDGTTVAAVRLACGEVAGGAAVSLGTIYDAT